MRDQKGGQLRPWTLAARRPAVPAALCFIVGVSLHPFVPAWPIVWLGAMAATLSVALAFVRRPLVSSISLAGCLLLAGLLIAQREAFWFSRDHIAAYTTDSPRLAQLELRLTDPPRIVGSPPNSHRALPPKQAAMAEATRVLTWDGWRACSGKVALKVMEPHPTLAVGQTIRVTAMLQRPAPAMNPGEFDWAAYYREQRVVASVSVGHAHGIQILNAPPLSWLDWWRERTRQALAAGFSGEKSLDQALLRALLLGDNDPELRDVQEDFKRTGTSHHLAISGLHIAVLGGFVLWICRLLRLRPRWSLSISLAFVLAYGVAALPSPPVVRLVLLCAIVGVGVLSRRSIDFVQLLALSVLGMLIVHPLDLYNAGFQLSFGTVLGLMLLAKPVHAAMTRADDPDQKAIAGLKPAGRVGGWLDGAVMQALSAGLVAWLISFPLIAYHFEQLNLWAIIGSILLAPIVFVALIGGLLKVVFTLLWPTLAATWATAAAWPMGAMRHAVDWLATLPLSDVPLPPPPIWLMGLFYLLLLAMARPCPRPGLRWCLRGGRVGLALAMLILPFASGAAGRAAGDELRITLLSVGAGQCAVIEPPSGRIVLLDAGSTSIDDLPTRTLGPFLRHRGLTSIDTVVVSHADYDHVGAVGEIAGPYKVREVLVGPRFVDDAAEKSAAAAMLRDLDALQRPPRVISRDDRLPLGSRTQLEVLWPPKTGAPATSNDTSLVLRLTHAGGSVLFSGDIEDAAMRALLKDPDRLKSDVLVAPHHGSSEKLTAAFVRAVDPKFVLSSNDRSLSVKQKRFEELIDERTLFRTHRTGTVTIRIRPDGVARVQPFIRSEDAGRRDLRVRN